MMDALKIVTAEEMVRIEKNLPNHEQLMLAVGKKVAEAVIEFIERKGYPKQVTLLVGRGNNGGDAYVAGIHLLQKGFQVHAYSIKGECSSLNKKFREKFQKKSGKITPKLEGVIIDGLLGTGFKGKLDEEMTRIIQEANASGLPILAIDIPSGLNGTTGEALVAIQATETIALGLLKIGFFLRDGWNHVGELLLADFGLPNEAIAEAEAAAYYPLCPKLPKIVRNRHKYQAGYVVGYGGSKALSGALKLTGFAALKAGAGIVRVFHPEPIGEAPYELICNDWDVDAWAEALKKSQAVFVGPGLGQCSKTTAWLKAHLKLISCPCVIDADALAPDLTYPKMAILTPHRGEVLRLLGLKTALKEEALFSKINRFCEEKEVILILKGAPTFIFAPHSKPFVIPRGDPGMATAGSGDVLTGVIAAFLAQKCSPIEAAILGVTLHAIAGEAAAEELTSYCITGGDLIDFMPVAFDALV